MATSAMTAALASRACAWRSHAKNRWRQLSTSGHGHWVSDIVAVILCGKNLSK
jgi:hypothetical protein